jgi:hypothetical protein
MPNRLMIVALGVSLLAGDAGAEARLPQAHPPGASARAHAPSPTTDSINVADIPAWRRITLGTLKGVNALRSRLDAAHVRVGASADEILGRPSFSLSPTRQDIDLVVVTVSQLGFADAASLADIHRRAVDLGLELCPAEAAPLVRLAYLDQPLGEFLNIAMRPVATYGGALVALTVANAGTGPVLIGGEGGLDQVMSGSAKFVFARPTRMASPHVP